MAQNCFFFFFWFFSDQQALSGRASDPAHTRSNGASIGGSHNPVMCNDVTCIDSIQGKTNVASSITTTTQHPELVITDHVQIDKAEEKHHLEPNKALCNHLTCPVPVQSISTHDPTTTKDFDAPTTMTNDGKAQNTDEMSHGNAPASAEDTTTSTSPQLSASTPAAIVKRDKSSEQSAPLCNPFVHTCLPHLTEKTTFQTVQLPQVPTPLNQFGKAVRTDNAGRTLVCNGFICWPRFGRGHIAKSNRTPASAVPNADVG